jgi:electron transport complex protein RnfC
MVRLGTLFDDLIDCAGGIKPGVGIIGKVIMGGPMMGLAQHRTDVPVIKGTSGILLLPELGMERPVPLACIRCGRCETYCPMKLPAARIGLVTEFEDYETAGELDVMECMECGVCSYVCPSMRPMTQYMRISKAAILEKQARAKASSGN